MTDDKPRYSSTLLQTNYLPKSYLAEQLDRKIAALGMTRAVRSHVPTVEALRTLWMRRMPFYNISEKIESEVGFEEWLNGLLIVAKLRGSAPDTEATELNKNLAEKDREIATLKRLIEDKVVYIREYQRVTGTTFPNEVTQ